MTTWPHTIPHDLDLALAELERRRHHISNADIWAFVREWLEKHQVEAPADLPPRPEVPPAAF